MLISHKLLRWVPYLLAPAAVLALGLLAARSNIAAMLLAGVVVGLVAGAAAIRYGGSIAFKPLSLVGFSVAALTAGFLAWCDALRGTHTVTWEPTPRPTASTS
jgi:hypothetical protein